MKRVFIVFISFILLIGIFPFCVVFADNPTYTFISSGECYRSYVIHRISTNAYFPYDFHATQDIRAVILNQNGSRTIYYFSDSFFTYANFNNNVGCVLNPTVSSNQYGSYYYYSVTINQDSNNVLSEINVVQINDTNDVIHAFNYTFGSNAVDPEPPGPDYGDLNNVSFYTDIAGNGNAAVNNLDHITWEPFTDSNGNQLPSEAVVEIQAIPGTYTAESKNALLGLGANAFTYNQDNAHLLASVPASEGEFQTTWRNTIDTLGEGSIADFLGVHASDNSWLLSGWVYQVRLVIDEYVSEWVLVRTATSSGVETSQTITNITTIDNSITQAINTINTLNNTTNNNYTFENAPISTDPDIYESDISSLFDWLRKIIVSITELPEHFKNVLRDIFDFDFDDTWLTERVDQVLDDSGALGECIRSIEGFKDTFDSYNDASQLAVIQWPDIYIGEQVVIPAGLFNLSSIVADDLHDFYLLYQTLVSGFLYVMMFRRIYKIFISLMKG